MLCTGVDVYDGQSLIVRRCLKRCGNWIATIHRMSTELDWRTTLIVSLDNSFPILVCDTGITRLLGYSVDDITGQSIARICGPKTDLLLLCSCIGETAVGTSNSARLVLYAASGQSRSICAWVCPLPDSRGIFLGCTITLAPPDTVSLTNILCENALPLAIVSARPPYEVLRSNTVFASTFGTQACPCNPPLTSFRASHSSIATWSHLLVSASAGMSLEGIVHAKSAVAGPELPWALRCAPVADRDNCRITALAAIFRPPPASAAATNPPPTSESAEPLHSHLTFAAGSARSPGPATPPPRASPDSPTARSGNPPDGPGLAGLRPGDAGPSGPASSAPHPIRSLPCADGARLPADPEGSSSAPSDSDESPPGSEPAGGHLAILAAAAAAASEANAAAEASAAAAMAGAAAASALCHYAGLRLDDAAAAMAAAAAASQPLSACWLPRDKEARGGLRSKMLTHRAATEQLVQAPAQAEA